MIRTLRGGFHESLVSWDGRVTICDPRIIYVVLREDESNVSKAICTSTLQ